MQRRVLLKGLAALPLAVVAAPAGGVAVPPGRGVRPGEPGWPDPAEWARLHQRVGGRLVKVTSPFAACTPNPDSPGCAELFQNLRDPFYISDSVALTQTLGWTDAWTSRASPYAVLAQSSADVAAAVKSNNSTPENPGHTNVHQLGAPHHLTDDVGSTRVHWQDPLDPFLNIGRSCPSWLGPADDAFVRRLAG
jgi:hypothetical protein